MWFALFIFSAASIYIFSKNRTLRYHDANMKKYTHRVHVNGIRGKSSVTRLIAASFREGNINTIGKTTGSAARLLINHKKDEVIERKEADIAEQKRTLDSLHGADYDAIVFECMAINPVYQSYLEHKIMHSTIGVITNVREDHTDVLGKTLLDIAKSLTATIPYSGHLVTAETNREVLAIFGKECLKRNTKMHCVGDMKIADKHMAKFSHFEYKSNVAVAIKVAQLAGIKRAIALSGMQKAIPDPGAFRLREIKRNKKKIHWANLFAINDRESFVMTTESLSSKMPVNTKKVIILNNRHDRPERVAQFVDIAVNSINAEYIVTFGDYEKQVKREMHKHVNSKNITIIHLGNTSQYRNASGKSLFNKIAKEIKESEFLLLGAVNIHSKQAGSLLKLLERQRAH
jgi:gamma-polyglutamate synthase